jgi:hypothetical protein
MSIKTKLGFEADQKKDYIEQLKDERDLVLEIIKNCELDLLLKAIRKFLLANPKKSITNFVEYYTPELLENEAVRKIILEQTHVETNLKSATKLTNISLACSFVSAATSYIASNANSPYELVNDAWGGFSFALSS